MAKKQIEQPEDDFDKLIREFIDSKINEGDTPDDAQTTDDLDNQTNDSFPFPKEIDDRVADAMINADREDGNYQRDVASVSVEVGKGCDKSVWWNAPVTITFKPKPRVRLRQFRFQCYIYDEAYYPVCCSSGHSSFPNPRSKNLTMEISCNNIWTPGNYILLIHDSCGSSVIRIEFNLDKDMKAALSEPHFCHYGDIDDILVGCMQDTDECWPFVAGRPGMVQFRKKALEARRLVLYNEVRKENELGEMKDIENLLICMRNQDISKDILTDFMRMMILDGNTTCTDCSTLFDLAYNNPYEPLTELLSDPAPKMLCLTHLKELTTTNGKVIMRKIIDKVRDANGKIPLWLCGSRQEIDEVLGLFPSLRDFFLGDCYVEQQPYTAFELVQAFLHEMVREQMQPNVLVKDQLARAVLQGYEQGVLTTWTMADIHRFVVEEVRPRYLSRAMDDMLDDFQALLREEDIPFEKLTSGSSAFDESVRELNEMVGLETVKEGIMTMANQARLFLERRRRGLRNSNSMIFHTIFTGNPGTGKTTVARKLGRIYRSLGLLSKGEVMCVDRTRLVGRYIGDTEENMKNILEEAKGNVLFIDEAYTLYDGASDRKDFGARVIDSLLTTLSQPNPDMMVVFAGYQKEMEAMLNTNPGFSGRFPYRYQFDDYSADQLVEIARHLLERDEYILSDEVAEAMQDAIDEALSLKSPNFGNARWIDQFVNNGIIPAMADRIYTTGCNDYRRIETSDIQKAFEKFKPKATELKPTRHRVKGFSA